MPKRKRKADTTNKKGDEPVQKCPRMEACSHYEDAQNVKNTFEIEIQRLKHEYNCLQQERDQLQTHLNRERQEKDDLLTRLSAVVSSSLRDNNPNIADLSDVNRPTKISEQFSELYDNEWTNGFEELQKYISEEHTIIEKLLEILKKNYDECKMVSSERFFEKVQRCIELPVENIQVKDGYQVVMSNLMKQEIKELRRNRASHVFSDVKQIIQSRLQWSEDDKKMLREDAVHKYMDRCTELCWLMAVQDPPLILYPTEAKDSKFNNDIYKPYTQRGHFIEFVVWPALCLHEGGPILCKGVAQCNNKTTIK